MENHRDNHLTHLTDEQFTDLLLGAIPSSVQAHLSVCPQCSQEAERVSGAIGSFAQHSRLWAERRAATAQPLQARDWHTAFPWLHRPQSWVAAGLAVALALSVGIGISLRVDHGRSAQQQQAAASVQPAAAVSPTTLKADNELLTAINGELRADDSATTSMYGLSGTSNEVRSKSSKRTSN